MNSEYQTPIQTLNYRQPTKYINEQEHDHLGF